MTTRERREVIETVAAYGGVVLLLVVMAWLGGIETGGPW